MMDDIDCRAVRQIGAEVKLSKIFDWYSHDFATWSNGGDLGWP